MNVLNSKSVQQQSSLLVKVLKAGRNLKLPQARDGRPTIIHLDKAAEWVPDCAIWIHAVSIPEQSEVSVYADIEVSTAQEMYAEIGHIFRVKYAGPGLLRNPADKCSYLGSNVSTTNIVFPAGLAIHVEKGTAIYVHLDLRNKSDYDIYPMSQDIYIYYTMDSMDR